jgi:hypothetical protein
LPVGLIDAFDAQFAWAAEADLLQAGIEKPDYSNSLYAEALEQVSPDNVTFRK